MREPENQELVFQAVQKHPVLNLILDCACCCEFLELLSDQKGPEFRTLKINPIIESK